ncbi:MAG: nitric oxide reductase subunit B [bacterium]|jgi:nitric oxide reductase subunit B
MRKMSKNRRLWLFLILTFFGSFTVLGLMGVEIYKKAPPIPKQVVTVKGEILFTESDIQTGKQVWQSMGGQQVGSIWGHGGYVAPDWSADWLHREAVGMLNLWAKKGYQKLYKDLGKPEQGSLRAKLQEELRKNTYNKATGNITISEDRKKVIKQVAQHYIDLFGNNLALQPLRSNYAIANNAIPDLNKRKLMTTFFFWTAWSTVTNRPDSEISYTNNWPAESLVGNKPTPATFMWSILSVLFLLAGIGLLGWYYAVNHGKEKHAETPKTDPLLSIKITPSMRATAKYFWTVIALMVVQVGLGAITAHYSVEGQGFYGFPLAEYLPYAVTRTWHTQIGIFWIATAWLAAGLYIAPIISGYEPPLQKWGVNFLWVCLLIIVVGSLGGEWLGVQQKLDLDTNFWFGHQGYELVDLGRFWQISLFIGLILWVVLVTRALLPALLRKEDNKQIIVMLFLSSVAIGLFYGAGLMWGKHTNLAMVEYWRWWVIHLWVEGFFEVFATSVIALLLTRMGLLRSGTATTAVLFSTVVFMFGGILGTFHHLYFTGTPTSVLALGASFSALEVVPLVFIGFEAYEHYKLSNSSPWVTTYRWPILFFIAVAFWNLVGAGLFGFLINPPIALYYMQGMNTTALHGHTALFGVYGMLGIGLLLFCLRGLCRTDAWSDTLLKYSFWGLNIGLAAMSLLSLLPIGLIQTWASVKTGVWYARSADLLHSNLVETFVWMRVPGDIIFSLGIGALAIFAIRLVIGSIRDKKVALQLETQKG